MRTLKFGIWIVGSLVTALAQEKELEAKDVTEKVRQRYNSIEDATARFTQLVKFGFSKIEQNFSGTLTMKRPNKFRVESEHQTLVTDGSTVWAYSPVNKQVIVDRYKENQNSLSPEQFLLRLPTNYYSSLIGREKSGDTRLVVLKLVPKDDQSFIKSMKVWVEEGTWIIRKVETTDVNDTETTYTVRDVKLNSDIKDSRFSFTPPPGTELVDLR
ncbi:MAG TPA: outer membrane lipoprotein carrier protein LolA [Bacteroidetes bacterium]|nr:outer membrane lipoprotein carrier protein LolA [Bacteroidota bacterium]